MSTYGVAKHPMGKRKPKEILVSVVAYELLEGDSEHELREFFEVSN